MDSHRQEQFARAFLQYQDRLYGHIVLMLPNRHDAEDVFQQTSLILWKKWDEFDWGGDFLAWACGIAHNEVRNFLRHRGRDRLVLSDKLLDDLADVRSRPALVGPSPRLAGRVHEETRFRGPRNARALLRGPQFHEGHCPAVPHHPQRAVSPPAADPPGADGVRPTAGGRGGRRAMNGESITLPPADGELARLVESMIDGTIAPEERDRLESLLADNPDAQLFYVASLDLHAQVQWLMRDGTTVEGRVAESGPGDRLSDERCSDERKIWRGLFPRLRVGNTSPKRKARANPCLSLCLRFGASALTVGGLGAWLAFQRRAALLRDLCAVGGLRRAGRLERNSPAFGPRAAKNIFGAGCESRRHRPADCRHDQPLGRLRLGRSEFGARGNGHPAGLLLLSRLRPVGDYIQHRNQGIDRRAGHVRRGRPRRRFSAIGSTCSCRSAPGQRTPAPNGGRRSTRGPGSDRPSGPVCPRLGDNPTFCVRFPKTRAHCHTVMSDRGGAYARAETRMGRWSDTL